MRIIASLVGRLDDQIEIELDAATEGISMGMRRSGRDLGARLRRATGRSLGARMAKLWRFNYYRNKGWDAASLVYSKAPHIIEGHMGSTIKPRKGRFLAIPTENVPKGRFGRRITPKKWPTRTYGPLQFVAARNGRPAMLVATGLTYSQKRQRFYKSRSKKAKMGVGTSTVVMFFLVPQVKLRRRLNIKRYIESAKGKLQNNIVEGIIEAQRKKRRR